ncbi:hypothetical protein E2I00_014177 [Balaenoptera physalus]|uniref:Uncharacterized protein n=1 Tax=Balaenoptera physalus TaxID=9770 RepID=A0A6A1Q1R1_BALPH|nr:hypothetical protein E2I00_014177 [Balaenoptera physalus]
MNATLNIHLQWPWKGFGALKGISLWEA